VIFPPETPSDSQGESRKDLLRVQITTGILSDSSFQQTPLLRLPVLPNGGKKCNKYTQQGAGLQGNTRAMGGDGQRKDRALSKRDENLCENITPETKPLKD
jgi:hypothetical protein